MLLLRLIKHKGCALGLPVRHTPFIFSHMQWNIQASLSVRTIHARALLALMTILSQSLLALVCSHLVALLLFSSGLYYKKLTYENYKSKALLLSGWVQLIGVIGRSLDGIKKGEVREFLSPTLTALG